ncbi:phosphopantetheine-binding protein [Streptomyces sp. rh34]|uniref:phosphopantetheine-binding protein n=1 Tax=Streptomyces sp. rh34 TaxID=2034272 RepID=UPI0015CF11B4|nr:phosphopantetheine-binding protein [Streptomyces sp. rh34]
MNSDLSVEDVVRTAWCEVLTLPGADLGDNFFTSGGHSFAAVELMAKVEESLPIEFPFQPFLMDGSLGALVHECELRLTAGPRLLEEDRG